MIFLLLEHRDSDLYDPNSSPCSESLAVRFPPGPREVCLLHSGGAILVTVGISSVSFFSNGSVAWLKEMFVVDELPTSTSNLAMNVLSKISRNHLALLRREKSAIDSSGRGVLPVFLE